MATSQNIGSYRIIRPLGSGGMGAVYEVVPISGGESLALKSFTSVGSHAEFLRKRFVAEGKILSKLNHPQLVKVYELGYDEVIGSPYFTMDMVLGPNGSPCTLEDLRRKGEIDERNKRWLDANRDKWNAYMRERRRKAKLDRSKEV